MFGNGQYIYADIEECKLIEENKHDDAEIQIYESPDKDKNLKDLQYKSFYGAYYSSSELEFEIFAYVFENKAISKKYYVQVTGRDDGRDISYYASGGMFSHRIAVIYNEMAYVVYTSPSQADDLSHFLKKVFSICVRDEE